MQVWVRLSVSSLFLLLHLFNVVRSDSAATNKHVTPVFGEPAFYNALALAPLVFVKFFHPACPHCQAMKKPYDEVATFFAPHSATLRFAQVDISTKRNSALYNRYVDDGVPNLKLFKRGLLLATFNGPRDSKSMVKWLQQRLDAYTAPIISNANDETALAILLKKAGDGPVVLSLSPAPPHADADARIERYATAARDAPGPPIIFARVPHPSLLVGDRKKYDAINDVYAAAPYAIAVRNASNFKSEAQWWFSGVLGGEPLHSFIAVATLPRDGTALLRSDNAPALSASARTILYAFGLKPEPDVKTKGIMAKLASAGSDDVVVVYVHNSEFEALRTHVGLPEASSSRETKYVLYRTSNRGAERRIYDEKDGELVHWLKRFIDEHGRFPGARGIAGAVTLASKHQLEEILAHDGRIVLLLACGSSCNVARFAVNEAAKMLKADARAVTVVEYVGDDPKPPSINGESLSEKRPYVAIVRPGSKPSEVRPSRALVEARHAIVAVSNSPDDVLIHEPSTFNVITLTHVGIMLTLLGIALTIQNHTLFGRLSKRTRRNSKSPASPKSV